MSRASVRLTVVAYCSVLFAPVGPLALGGDWRLLAPGAGLGAVLGTVATANRDPVELLDTPLRALAGFVPPLAWVGPALSGGSLAGAIVSPWAVGVGAIVVWLAVVASVDVVQHAERRAELETVTSFRARPPSRTRRALSATAVVLGGLALALVGLVDESATDAVTSTLPVLVAVPVVVSMLYRDTEVRLTDGGVVVDGAVREWDSFESYELTDAVLRLRTAGTFGDREFDRGDIDDVEAVTDVLSRHIPRSSGS